MTEPVQTVIVAVIVALAAGVLLWRNLRRKAKPGCGCDGCPTKAGKR